MTLLIAANWLLTEHLPCLPTVEVHCAFGNSTAYPILLTELKT